jgi:hypothetical protein
VRDAGVQLALELGEVRWRAVTLAADDRGVVAMGEHRHAGPGANLGGRTGVVVMEVGEHHPPQRAEALHNVGDRGPGACRAGVDQR